MSLRKQAKDWRRCNSMIMNEQIGAKLGKAGAAAVSGAKKCLSTTAAENIASGFTTMCKSALDKVGKGLFSLFFGARNKSAVNPHREVRIHAFGG